jgi:hypothetical protein
VELVELLLGDVGQVLEFVGLDEVGNNAGTVDNPEIIFFCHFKEIQKGL